jgi:glutamate--cysteine ligase
MTQIMQHLAQVISQKRSELEAWFAEQYSIVDPLLYCSVDIRYSGFKIAPVDTNIYPAGFNNLDASACQRASAQVQQYINKYAKGIKNIAIIPENHTRNAGYISNLITLVSIIEDAGFQVIVGRVEEGVASPVILEGMHAQQITSYPLQRRGDLLVTESGFQPELYVMNMDMTSGVPTLLQGIAQPIIPSVMFGWYQRRKSTHFEKYQRVADEIATLLGVHPWTLSAIHQQCGRVNFKERTGLECVALNVERVLHGLHARYAEYGITQQPYVFIKADSGTYGMGIMTAHSGEDVLSMNKKIRNKMDVIKEGAVNTEVIIQEGVPTILDVDGKVAEPFIYLVGGQVVGGIWRVNDTRDAYVSLNASGVNFVPMQEDCSLARASGHALVYGVIAMLASLAAAKESY